MKPPVMQLLIFTCQRCECPKPEWRDVELWEDPVITPPSGWGCAGGLVLPGRESWDDNPLLCPACLAKWQFQENVDDQTTEPT